MSSFFDRKIRTLYSRFDVDGSGSIDVADFTLWGERLVAYGHLNEQQTVDLRNSLSKLWSHYFCPMDDNHDKKVSCAELTKHIKDSLNDQDKKANWKEIIPLIFEAIDADKDGAISHDEFNNYFKSLNINDRAMAEEVFRAIDLNNDGSLSSDEFLAFGEHFFTETNEADPSKIFFGRLVD